MNCEENERAEWFFFQYELETPDALLLRGINDTHYSEALSLMTRPRDVRRCVQEHMLYSEFFSAEILRFTRYVDEE